jgi:hypothetical protein
MDRIYTRRWRRISSALALLALVGCSTSENPPEKSAADAGSAQDAQPTASNGPCGVGSFESTFAAIQKVIFEGYGCTEQLCHGSKVSGGLDLRPESAYQNLLDVKATGSMLKRVMPGEPGESYLFNKLRAATEPGSVEIAGTPMPSGSTPISAKHLEALRLWIESGAPRTGSIGDPVTGGSKTVADLLGSCLPAVTPIEISPLEKPADDEGVQFVMPPFVLESQREVEVCFAQYYDFSDVVPPEHQDTARGVFFVNGMRVRQDPHSHHLVLTHSRLGADVVKDKSFGSWSCHGGASDGDACDPLAPGACGSGQCGSEAKNATGCFGFGPPGGVSFDNGRGIASTGSANWYSPPREGLYEEVPIRGILYWNAHAFNLTDEATHLHAWVNILYAKERRNVMERDSVIGALNAAAGVPPFQKKLICADWVVPSGTNLLSLSSHTHKRGGKFTIAASDGKQIYESFIYTDPIDKEFDPPLRFDSPNPAERTLHYCAEFNNGVAEDGSPNVEIVTRSSRMPERTSCVPVACVAGKVGSPCSGAEDNATCDSAPNAADGSCDACPITAGATTENEMFTLAPVYYITK